MDDLTFQIEKIAGQAREDAECAVFNKKIILADGQVGNLVCCLLVRNSAAAQAQVVTCGIFEIAQRKLDDAEGPLLEVLKSVLDSARAYLDSQEAVVSFIIVLFYKNACYVVRLGEEVRLVLFSGSEKAQIDFESGSGPVAEGQTYLAATDKFLEHFEEGLFQSEQIGLSETIDGLATEISAFDDQAEMGAVFIKIKQAESGRQEPIEERGSAGGSEKIEGLVSAEWEREEGTRGEKADGLEGENEEGYKGAFESEHPALTVVKTRQSLFNLVSRVTVKAAGELKKIRSGNIKAILRLRRNILIIVVLIIVSLAGLAGYQVWQKHEKGKQLEINGFLESARSKLNEGAALIELNKSRARQILVSAQEEARKAQKTDKNNREVSEILSEIDNKLKETEVTSSISFSTLAEVGSGLRSLAFNGSKIEAIGEDKVFEIDSSGKTTNEYGGITGVKNGVVFDSKAFILTESEAVKLDFAGGKISKIADASRSRDIGVFFGNVYLMKTDQISKITPIEGGYAEPRDYLESKQNFGDLSRMAIDSLVWVTNGRKILKFNRGALENFEINGLPEGSGEFGLIFTDSNLDNLYVVDRLNSVLLVIDKKGQYKQALSAPEFGRATDILVNDGEDRIFIAEGNKILTTGLTP